MSRRRLPAEVREQAVKRAIEGEKLDAIATDLQVSTMSVHRWLEELGYYPQRVTKWVRIEG